MKLLTNWSNYPATANPRGEVNLLPSATIPDMVEPIERLIERFVRDGSYKYQPVYTDSDIPDGVEYMDEQDRLQAAADLKVGIEDWRSSRRGAKVKPVDEVIPPTEGSGVTE